MKSLKITRDIEYGFVMESMKNEGEIDYSHLNTAYLLMMNKTTESIAEKINGDTYNRYIQTSRDTLKSVTSINISEFIDFFSSVYNKFSGDEVNISISIMNINEVDRIRPQYLSKITTDLKLQLEKLFAGKEADDFAAAYKNEEYVNRIKRDMVKTTLPLNINKQSIFSNNGIVNIEVTDEYIQTNVIPFVRSLPISVKSLENDILAVQTSIDKGINELNLCIAAVNKLINSGNVHIKRVRKIHKFLYNMIANFNTCAAYVTFMLIRKVNAYSYNMISFHELYNTIRGFYPETVEMFATESGELEENLKLLDDIEICNSILTNRFGVLKPYLNNKISRERDMVSVAIHKRLSHNIINSIDEFIVDYDYEDYIYNEIEVIFEDIFNTMDNFGQSLMTGSGLNDTIEEVGLTKSFETMYKEVISKIDDINNHYVDRDNDLDMSDNMLSVYKELTCFDEHINDICNKATKAKEKMNELLNTFKSRTNVEELRIESDDISDFITDTLLPDFSHLCSYIGRKLIKRAMALSDLLNDLTTDVPIISKLEESNADEYMSITLESMLDEIDGVNEVCFIEATKEYEAYKAYMEKGITMIYEAGEEGPSKVESMKAFFERIISAFMNKVSMLLGNHSKWLAENKEGLLALDTNGVTISMLPYDGFDPKTITGIIDKATSKVNGIQVATIYNSSSEQIQANIYDFIPSSVKDSTNSLGARTKQYFSVGTKGMKPVSVSGEKVKARINGMITFCEGYEKLTNSIKPKLTTFSDAVDRKANELTKSKTGPVTESVEDYYMEAEGEQKPAATEQQNTTKPQVKVNRPTQPTVEKATTNKPTQPGANPNEQKKTSVVNNNKYASALRSDAKSFTSNTLIALEARYVDYINTLRSLIRQTKS